MEVHLVSALSLITLAWQLSFVFQEALRNEELRVTHVKFLSTKLQTKEDYFRAHMSPLLEAKTVGEVNIPDHAGYLLPFDFLSCFAHVEG